MTTTSLRVTAIVSADVPIITVKRRARNAPHAYAGLLSGAYIAVRAIAVVITLTSVNQGMETPLLRITGVGGATIAIITINERSALTYPIGATVTHGADIAIITGQGSIHILTACLCIAAIGGARITVIAAKRDTRNTLAGNTGFYSRTHIIITAITVFITLAAFNRGVETPFFRIAGIGGTAIAIITINQSASHAHPIGTMIT